MDNRGLLIFEVYLNDASAKHLKEFLVPMHEGCRVLPFPEPPLGTALHQYERTCPFSVREPLLWVSAALHI